MRVEARFCRETSNATVIAAQSPTTTECTLVSIAGVIAGISTDGAHLGRAGEHIGIWASPIVWDRKIYIGGSNHYLYCLTADKGEVVWKYKARGPIWGSSPVVDGRVVFGDKAGWMHLLSAADGKEISELKIGDNVNSTPAVLDGRIYIGAFNGKLYCLGLEVPVKQETPTPEESPVVRPQRRHKPRAI